MKTIKQINNEVFGDCFSIKEFAECVKCKEFIPYDGYGFYHDGEKETEEMVSFNYKDILAHKNQYPYVIWYNK